METIPLNSNSRPQAVSYSSSSSAAGAAASTAAAAASHDSGLEDDDDKFCCNICLDSVKDPVVTQCGHLYCWPCLFRWLKTQHGTCPVCKSGVTEENVIPIYVRGAEPIDPRFREDGGASSAAGSSAFPEGSGDAAGAVPSRPQGRRIDATTQNVQQGLGGAAAQGNPFGGITMTASYGYFPSLFGLQFQNFTQPVNRPVSPEEESQRKYLSNTLYALGAVVVVCLVCF